jgi:hypothetical protein
MYPTFKSNSTHCIFELFGKYFKCYVPSNHTAAFSRDEADNRSNGCFCELYFHAYSFRPKSVPTINFRIDFSSNSFRTVYIIDDLSFTLHRSQRKHA